MPRFNNKNQRSKQQKPRDKESDLDGNPILKEFQAYSLELDDKHDRRERIVKLSRDITIEAKRIIFLLHTIDERKQNKSRILTDAGQRLQKIIDVLFKAIARELDGQDPYQYRWAYSPGLQEFIEAFTFYEYFRKIESSGSDSDDSDLKISDDGCMSDWNALQEKMHFEETVEAVLPKQETANTDQTAEIQLTDALMSSNLNADVRKFQFFVDPTEYILGVSDLTGELMRRCINSLGSGETIVCAETCAVLQAFYTGYLSLHVQRCRELSRKIFTMRQSLLKAENVCYNVCVRGGEAAKWGASLDNKQHNEDVDEGFF